MPISSCETVISLLQPVILTFLGPRSEHFSKCIFNMLHRLSPFILSPHSGEVLLLSFPSPDIHYYWSRLLRNSFNHFYGNFTHTQ